MYDHKKEKEVEAQKLLKKIIDLMVENGVKMETPYDFQNWMYDNAREHEKLFAAYKFPCCDEDE